MAWIKYEEKLAAKQRKKHVAAVRKAFNSLPLSVRVDMMRNFPELYWACASLSSHEQAREEYERTYGR